MLAATQSQIVDANATAISSISDVPPYLLPDDLTWRLISDEDGSVVIAESSDGIVSVDDGRDAPNVRYDRQFTAPATPGRYLAIWRAYYDDEIDQQVVVAASAAATFATTDDVATRLGRTLNSDEEDRAMLLLNLAAAVIADAVDKDDGWAVTLSPVPTILRLLSAELVARNFDNPGAYTSLRQQVGSYSIAVTQGAPGMILSDTEVAMCRRAIYGRTTDSTHVDSGFIAAQDEYWLQKQNRRMRENQKPGSTWLW